MNFRPSDPRREVDYSCARQGVIIGFDRCDFGNTPTQLTREFNGKSLVLFRDCNFGPEGVSFKCKKCYEHLAWTRDIQNIVSERAENSRFCSIPGYNEQALLQTFKNCHETEDGEEDGEADFRLHYQPTRSPHHMSSVSGETGKRDNRPKRSNPYDVACIGADGSMEHPTEISATQCLPQQSANVQDAFQPMEIEEEGALALCQSTDAPMTAVVDNSHMSTSERSRPQVNRPTPGSPLHTSQGKSKSCSGLRQRNPPGEDIDLMVVLGANVRAQPLIKKHPAQTWYKTAVENAFCTTCQNHIGWVFTSKDTGSFFGLSMKEIIVNGN